MESRYALATNQPSMVAQVTHLICFVYFPHTLTRPIIQLLTLTIFQAYFIHVNSRNRHRKNAARARKALWRNIFAWNVHTMGREVNSNKMRYIYYKPLIWWDTEIFKLIIILFFWIWLMCLFCKSTNTKLHKHRSQYSTETLSYFKPV